MADNKFKFGAKLREVARIKQTIGTKLSNEAVNHFKGNFRAQGFVDSTIEKWQPRKKADPGRAILVKSGRLRNSIRVTKKTVKEIRIGSDVVYAPVHNYGLKAGRGKGFRMSVRKFLGKSAVLTAGHKRILTREFGKVFK